MRERGCTRLPDRCSSGSTSTRAAWSWGTRSNSPTPIRPRNGSARPGATSTRTAWRRSPYEITSGANASTAWAWARSEPCSGLRALRANLLHLGEGLTKVLQPIVLLLGHQAHAPCQRVAARASHAGIDQGVQNASLWHAKPGHGRDRDRGEQLGLVAASGAPRDPSAEPALGLVGDPHPLPSRVLPKAVDPGSTSRDHRLGSRVLGQLRLGKRPHHQDLLSIGGHLRWPGEPRGGKPPGEPTCEFLLGNVH